MVGLRGSNADKSRLLIRMSAVILAVLLLSACMAQTRVPPSQIQIDKLLIGMGTLVREGLENPVPEMELEIRNILINTFSQLGADTDIETAFVTAFDALYLQVRGVRCDGERCTPTGCPEGYVCIRRVCCPIDTIIP